MNAARLAVAAPWVVLLLLGTQPETLRAYDSTGGVLLLAIGAAVCLAAYRIMLAIGKLPEERRVLAGPRGPNRPRVGTTPNDLAAER